MSRRASAYFLCDGFSSAHKNWTSPPTTTCWCTLKASISKANLNHFASAHKRSTTYPCPRKKNLAFSQLPLCSQPLYPKCRCKACGCCWYNRKEGRPLMHGTSVQLQRIFPPATVEFCGHTDAKSTPQLFLVSKKHTSVADCREHWKAGVSSMGELRGLLHLLSTNRLNLICSFGLQM